MGLGDFWKSGVISVLTDFDTCIQAVELSDTEYVPYLNEWEYYDNGNNIFNFFIEDLSYYNKNSITKEKLDDLYGECIEVINYDDAMVYKYDYDVRTRPLDINQENMSVYLQNGDSLQVQPNGKLSTNNIYLTTGRTRLTLTGYDLSDLEVESSNSDEIVLVARDKNQLVYEVKANSLLENLVVTFINSGKESIELSNIRFERLSNSVEIKQNERISLRTGKYYFALEGENIKNSKISFAGEEGESFFATRISNGEKKVLYEVEVKRDQEVNVEIKGKGEIRCGYYQNQVLSSFNNPYNSIYKIENGIKWDDATNTYYGPYASLEKGKYFINIHGENLDNFDVSFTSELNQIENVLLVKNQDSYYKYYMETENKLTEFEIKLLKKLDASLDYYSIEKIMDEDVLNTIDLKFTPGEGGIISLAKCENEIIVLKKEEFCYGPYISLPKGVYELTIEGDNVDLCDIELTADNGNSSVEYVKDKEDGKLLISFELQDIISNFEVVIKNNSMEEVKIDNYSIRSE